MWEIGKLLQHFVGSFFALQKYPSSLMPLVCSQNTKRCQFATLDLLYLPSGGPDRLELEPEPLLLALGGDLVVVPYHQADHLAHHLEGDEHWRVVRLAAMIFVLVLRIMQCVAFFSYTEFLGWMVMLWCPSCENIFSVKAKVL